MTQSIPAQVFLQKTVPNTDFFNSLINMTIFAALTVILFYITNILVRRRISKYYYLIKLLLLFGAVMVSSLLVGWVSVNMIYLIIILGIRIRWPTPRNSRTRKGRT